MRIAVFLTVGMVISGSVWAQSASEPAIVANDSWVYKHTTEKGTGFLQTRVEITVERSGNGSVVIASKPAGSNVAPVEVMTNDDWSRARSVNGHQTVVNKPFNFPLRIGKTWTVEYIENNPNRVHTSEHFTSHYKVVGWEDVTVAAGTFHALKIEADGDWQAAIAPAVTAGSTARVDAQGSIGVVATNRVQASTAEGRTYKAFWYVPEVKRWVKSVEEYYSSGGVRNERFSDELESYKVSG